MTRQDSDTRHLRHRFAQLMAELERQDEEVRELYELAGVDEAEIAAVDAKPAEPVRPAPVAPSIRPGFFMVRG